MNTLKRMTALLLAILLAFVLTACGPSPDPDAGTDNGPAGDGGTQQDGSTADHADNVSGFADAMTYMRGETNLREEVTLSVKLSEDARPVALSQLINEVFAAAQSDTENAIMGLLTGLASTTEIGLSIVSEIYDGSVRASIGWAGPNGVEDLLTFAMLDNAIYISTEVLGLLGGIDALAEQEIVATVLGLIDCDYIKIDLETLPDLLSSFGLSADDLSSLTDSMSVDMDAIWPMMETIYDTIREYTPQILTEDYALTRSGDAYTLTLNADSLLSLTGDIIVLMAEYEGELKAFLLDFFSTAGLGGTDLAEIETGLASVSFADLAGQFDGVVAEIRDEIPAFDMSMTVAGTGDGASKRLTSSFDFSMSAAGIDEIPFEAIILSGTSTSAVMAAPIAEPSGKVSSLEELVGKIMLAMMGAMNAA
jgi:hypothetical protein